MKKIGLLQLFFFVFFSNNAQTLFTDIHTDLSDQSLRIEINKNNGRTTFVAKGPTTKYFAFGFKNAQMNTKYTIVLNTTSNLSEERILDDHNIGTLLTNTLKVISNVEDHGISTITFERDTEGLNTNYFNFGTVKDKSQLDIIFAQGTNKSFNYHSSSKGSVSATFATLFATSIEKKETLHVSFHPNPTQNIVTVSFDHIFESTEVTILNSSYAPIKNEQFHNSNSVEVSLEDYENGTYYISIKNADFSVIEQISKY
jgi:hypothetical protein